jgi:dipeptidyl aminopeptidase/acylaminoacyl peptidase
MRKTLVGPWVLLFAALPAAALAAVPAAAESAAYPIDRYLNVRSASGPALSPDGTRIAFLTNITGFNQIWTVGAQGGWPEQVTFYPDRVQWVSWSPWPAPAGTLLFGKDTGGDERTQLYMASPDGSRITPLTANPKVIHRFGALSHDGKRIAYSSNERAEAQFDVYVMDLETRKATRVLTHDGDNAASAWSPDDRSLVIGRSNASLDDDLFLLDLGSSSLKRLTPHEGAAVYDDVSWPPGDLIYLASDQGRDFLNVAAIDVRDPSPKATFVEDRAGDVQSVLFSLDGRRALIAYNEEGTTRLSLREGGLKGREMAAPQVPAGLSGGFEFSRDGRWLALRAESSTEPGDIWIHDTKTGAASRATASALAGIPRGSFVEPELVRFRSFDGLEVPAFLYLPATAGGGHPAPCIVVVHGGPESQARPGFSAVNQFFINRGYAVLAPNIRGSTGYGKKYHRLDDVRLREGAIEDVAAAARYLKGSGRVDPSRIAVMGGSYGGYMTLAAVTFHPDLWAAGVDIVGISNFRSFLKNTGAWRVKLRMSEYGDPEKDGEFLDKISPFNFVEKIRAPLMVIQGANDPRVPRTEADQMVESLRRRGSPVEYLLFDDEGHGIVKLPNRIKAYTAVADFLDKHLALSSPSR